MVGFAQNVPSITGEYDSMMEHDIQCVHGVQEFNLEVENYARSSVGQNTDIEEIVPAEADSRMNL